MDTLDTQVLDAVRGWAAQGRRFVLLTVARTWGSAPRPPGAWMAVRDDGVVAGSVSGGCVEADIITRVGAGEFTSLHLPQVVRYGVHADEARRFGLPCGGTLELVLEPQPDQAALHDLHERISAGQLVLRSLCLRTGDTRLHDGGTGERVHWDGAQLRTPHGPAWRLLIIGAGQISAFLAPMALALGYRVLVCDPRGEYTAQWQVAGTELVPGMPDDAVTALAPDTRTAVVALTHDPKLDDLALLEALKSPAFYVGALGSQASNRARRARLLQYFDLSRDEVARLHGPVGLPIGSRTPPEIALAVVAEMTALKNGCLAQARAPLASAQVSSQ